MAVGKIIGRLRVVVGLDQSDLDAGATRVSRTLGSMGRVAAATSAVVAALGVAAATAAVVIGTKLTRESLSAIDAQSKLAARTNTTVASIQALERAASLSGIEISSLDRSFDNLNRRLGEAILDTGSQSAEVLEAIGLSARDLLDLEMDERLATIADRFVELNLSTAEQAQILRDLGIRQAEFVNLMSTGGDAIRGARDELERFNLQISDVDASKIEAANDAMSTIGFILSDIGNELAISLAPILSAVSDELVSLAEDGLDFGTAIDSGIDIAARVMGAFADEIVHTQVTFLEMRRIGLSVAAALSDAWAVLAENVAGVMDAIREGWNSIASAIPGLEGMVNESSYAEWASQMRAESDALADSVSSVEDEIAALENAPMPSEQITRWLEEARQKSEETALAALEARRALLGQDDPETEEDESESDINLGDDGGGGGGGGGGSDLEAQLERQLETLRSGLMTQEEAELESYERRLEQLREFYENGMITQQEFTELRERLESDHQDKLTEITRRAEEERRRIQSETLGRITSTLDAIGSAMASAGEEQFGIAKAISVATALLKGYEAVTSSYAAGAAIGGPPLGALYAGLAAAATAAQISQLMAVNPRSSGTPMAGGGSAAGESAAPIPEQQQLLVIRGLDPNSLFTGEAVRQLADQLIEFQSDGGQVVISR